MKINTILRKLLLKTAIINHKVTGLAINSNDCQKGVIFFLFESNKKYLVEAIKNGAKTVFTTDKNYTYNGVNFVKVCDVYKTLSDIAKIYYNDVSKKLDLIGFTGTNGKTTTSTIGYNFFNYIGRKSMLIGSNGIYYDNNIIRTNNTTPDILTIYKYLDIAYKKKIKYVFMELSSIGIEELRVVGINYKIVVFTNLTQDHLDYHKTLENYKNSKLKVFLSLPESSYSIINIDDSNAIDFIRNNKSNIITYGLKEGIVKADFVQINKENSIFIVDGLKFTTKLLGEFNVYNCLSILALLKIYKIDYKKYMNFLVTFEGVAGRMNKYVYENKTIIIDYAHTYQGFVSAIDYVCSQYKNPCIIIGCGGNREKEKRFMLGKYLNTINATLCITTDNPRYEKPLDIIKDIANELDKDAFIFIDRKQAIKRMLYKSKNNDVILIIGKGNEDYMDINGVKHHYSDLETINEYYNVS